MNLQPVKTIYAGHPQRHDPQARMRLKTEAGQCITRGDDWTDRALGQKPDAPAGPRQGVRRVQRLNPPRLGGREVEAADVDETATETRHRRRLSPRSIMATTASAQ